MAGSVDVLYLVNLGTVSWGTYFLGFMLPTLIGNIIGGVSLVATLNFAQVAAEVIASSENVKGNVVDFRGRFQEVNFVVKKARSLKLLIRSGIVSF